MQDFFKLPITGGIIGMGLYWIFTFSYKQKIKLFLSKPDSMAFALLYLVHFVSIFYSDGDSEALNDLRLKMSLLLIPFFMVCNTWIKKQQILFLLKFFALVMICMSLLDLSVSLIEFIKHGDSDVFFYNKLSHILRSKAHYSSWYYSFAIFVIIHEIFQYKRHIFLWSAGLFILIISMLLLASRIYIFAFFVIFIISIILAIKRGNLFLFKWKILSILFLFVIGVFTFQKTNSRIFDTINELDSLMGSETTKQTNPRVYIWSFGFNCIKEKPFLGHGIGDGNIVLNEALKNCDAQFWNGKENIPIYKKNYNYHSQFLQTWAEVGFLGFFILIFLLFRPFFLSNSHPLFLIFLGLTIFGFITESILERQAGVLFFSFMYPLLSDFNKASQKDTSIVSLN